MGTGPPMRYDYARYRSGAMAERQLPAPDDAREWLSTMLLIRRFEERAGEMYAKAKVGGFLHLAIGEEATILGSVRAMRDEDYLISTYRSHGHALARGTHPDAVMAELFGRVDGCSKGRGGSMHMFDLDKRFMGGYGIVGGNLPLAAGMGLASDYLGNEDVTLCQFGDGASNQGTFGETMNLAALWKLPVVFMVTNNQYGMGTALERHSAVTDLQVKGEGFGVPGMECDGMDPVDTYEVTREALRIAREERRPILVEAVTYRFRGHSMADPEEYRTKEQVEEWRRRDPIETLRRAARGRGRAQRGRARPARRGGRRAVDEAVRFADASPTPRPSRSTTTSTCSAARCAAGSRWTSARRRRTAARTSAAWRAPSSGPRSPTRRRCAAWRATRRPAAGGRRDAARTEG